MKKMDRQRAEEFERRIATRPSVKLKGSTADLIREIREERDRELDERTRRSQEGPHD